MTDEPTRPHVHESVTSDHSPPETVNCTVDHVDRTTVAAVVPAAPRSEVGVPGYEVLGELGRGGMGVVYRAKNVRLNRDVALKLMLVGGSPDRREVTRFLAEAEAVAAVRHQNVIQIYESGEAGGQPYMVLELLPGGTLTERFPSLIGKPPNEAAGIIAKVARGVAAAHELGIVHRDLKPGNVLLDEHGEPKVTDFGLAKVASAGDLTRTGAIFGTPAYMAPEQASGNAKFVGPQADVWALGVMLHEALAGQRPFHNSNVSALLAMIREEEPQSLRALNRTIPRDLDVICRKCLEKNPTDRYPTARELADDLTRFIAGESITARSAGVVERSVKWMKRKPALAGLYAAMTIAAISLGVGALLWRSESVAREEKQNADEARAAAETARNAAESAKADAEHAATQARVAEANEKGARAKAEAGEKREAALRDDIARLEYARTIDLAHREFQVNDIARARILLQNCREDLRGWEWHHVNRLCHADTLTVSVCKYLCAVSPDGKRGVDWVDGKLRLLDLSTGTVLWVATEHYAAEPGVAFHPDGTEIAVYERFGNNVEVLDTKTAKSLRVLGVHDEKIKGSGGVIAYNRAGTHLLTTNNMAATTKVWDAKTGEVRFVTPKQDQWPMAGAFSPDGKRILVVDYIGGACVWDLQKGERTLELTGHTQQLRAAAFTPDGSKMLTAGSEGVRVWDSKNGAPLKSFAAEIGGVSSMTLDTTGTRVLTGSGDRTVRIWDLATGAPIGKLLGHTNWVSLVAFTADGSGVVSGGSNEAARVWRLPSLPTGIVGRGKWDDGQTNSVGISADGNSLFAGGNGDVASWDTRTGRPIPIPRLDGELVGTSAVSPDGTVAAIFQTSRITIRKLNPVGSVVRLEYGDFRSYSPTAKAFSPDGKLLAASDGSRVFIWDTASGKILTKYAKHTQTVHRLALGANGQVISVGDDVTVQVWEAKTGKQLHTQAASERHSPSAFNRDGTRIVTTCLGEGLVVCDTETLTPLLKIPSGATALAFSPDGTRIVAGQGGGDVKVFDARSGTELLTLRGHTSWLTAMAFTPDGQRFITTAADGTARTWETAPINRTFIKSPNDAR